MGIIRRVLSQSLLAVGVLLLASGCRTSSTPTSSTPADTTASKPKSHIIVGRGSCLTQKIAVSIDSVLAGVLDSSHPSITKEVFIGKHTIVGVADSNQLWPAVTVDVEVSKVLNYNFSCLDYPEITIELDNASCTGRIDTASVTLDGQPLGKATAGKPVKATNLKPGKHTLTASSRLRAWPPMSKVFEYGDKAYWKLTCE